MSVECPYCETETDDMDHLTDHLEDAHGAFTKVTHGDLGPLVDAALKK